jgi:hypothetical protein
MLIQVGSCVLRREVEGNSEPAIVQPLAVVSLRVEILAANKIKSRTPYGTLVVLSYWKSEGPYCPQRSIRTLLNEAHFSSRLTGTQWLPLYERSGLWLRTEKLAPSTACPRYAGN